MKSEGKRSKYAAIDASLADTDALGIRSSWDYAYLCVKVTQNVVIDAFIAVVFLEESLRITKRHKYM